MNRPNHTMLHQWHVAINAANQDPPFRRWMYDAKAIADEVPRLVRLLALERTGSLPKLHQQCSHSTPETITDNHLTCCLGVECRSCEALQALDKAQLPPEQIDTAKAWTCVAHILREGGDVDTTEGYVLTTDDRMYWDRLYQSLSYSDEDEEATP